MPISIEAIEDAFLRIDPVFLNAPQFELDALNDLLGFRLLCKVETLNPIRSFKGRGADYFVTRRLETSPGPTRLVCASAGNFGQGMAYACRKHGLPLTVFAAEKANPLKLSRMRSLGAEVVLQGHDFDAAKEAARDYAERTGLTFVEDSRDPEITEGAGTIGLELARDPERLDALLIALGNGALINGVGAYFKAKRPETRVIGVVAAGAPAMLESFRQGRSVVTERADTIADGVAVRSPVPEALELLFDTTDEVVAVTDAAILKAMRTALELFGLVLEPAGAVGLAAAQSYRERFLGQRLATVFCGGNLSAEAGKQ